MPSPAAAAPGGARAPARPGPAQRLAQLAAAPESPRVDARRGPGRPPGRCAPAQPTSAQPASHRALAEGCRGQVSALLVTRAAVLKNTATGCRRASGRRRACGHAARPPAARVLRMSARLNLPCGGRVVSGGHNLPLLYRVRTGMQAADGAAGGRRPGQARAAGAADVRAGQCCAVCPAARRRERAWRPADQRADWAQDLVRGWPGADARGRQLLQNAQAPRARFWECQARGLSRGPRTARGARAACESVAAQERMLGYKPCSTRPVSLCERSARARAAGGTGRRRSGSGWRASSPTTRPTWTSTRSRTTSTPRPRATSGFLSGAPACACAAHVPAHHAPCRPASPAGGACREGRCASTAGGLSAGRGGRLSGS